MIHPNFIQTAHGRAINNFSGITALRKDSQFMGKIQNENAAKPVEVRSKQCGGLCGIVAKQNPETFFCPRSRRGFCIFQENGFAVIRNAYSDDELKLLNAFFDKTQTTCPRAWGRLLKRPYYTEGHPLHIFAAASRSS